MKTLLVVTISCLFLTACSGVGVATSGAQAVYDRYSIQRSLTNHEITAQINNTFTHQAEFASSSINVNTFNFRVLLVGTVPTEALKEKAAWIAAYTHDVQHVYNFINVGNKEGISDHVHDAWVTTKIKSKIIAAAKMDPGSIKVVTENGIVYLMGTLSPEQAQIAVNTAQHTAGVKEIIKIFEYVTLSDKVPDNTA